LGVFLSLSAKAQQPAQVAPCNLLALRLTDGQQPDLPAQEDRTFEPGQACRGKDVQNTLRQRILAASFNGIVVEFDATVVDVAREALPAGSAQRMASASLIFWLMRACLARSQASKASASGRLFCCRTKRRSSGLLPRSSFTIA